MAREEAAEDWIQRGFKLVGTAVGIAASEPLGGLFRIAVGEGDIGAAFYEHDAGFL